MRRVGSAVVGVLVLAVSLTSCGGSSHASQAPPPVAPPESTKTPAQVLDDALHAFSDAGSATVVSGSTDPSSAPLVEMHLAKTSGSVVESLLRRHSGRIRDQGRQQLPQGAGKGYEFTEGNPVTTASPNMALAPRQQPCLPGDARRVLQQPGAGGLEAAARG